MRDETTQRDRLAALVSDAILADEATSGGNSPVSRDRSGFIAARLIAADVRVAGETYAAHPFKIGGYLTEEAPDNECVWRVDAFSPYCGITRADHDDVLDRRRTGAWYWSDAQNAEHDAILSAASELAVRVGPDEGGVMTWCPSVGVHEHAFRGPHKFREWDPTPISIEERYPPSERLTERLVKP